MLKQFSRKIKPTLSLFYKFSQFHFASKSFPVTKSWKLKVEPFWKLCVKVSQCNVRIETDDPNINIDGKDLLVQLLQPAGANTCRYKILNHTEENTVTISNFPNESENMDELHIKVPAAFDIDVLTSRSEFTSVTDLESTTASIKAQDGDIFVKNIKSGDIKLIANRGGISCKKLLQGNILINAASKIRTDRLQGPIIELKSDSDIHTQDVYAEEVTITSKETVGIKSIHGKSKVFSEESDVIIGTVEGESEVQAENGTANLHIAQHSLITVKAGQVYLSMPPDLAAKLDFTAPEITFSKEISQHTLTANVNGGGPVIQAKARQQIKCDSKSWLQRMLQYGKMEKDLCN